jgi:hypothetical protein
MKRLRGVLLLVAIGFLLLAPASSQTVHSVALNWSASSTAGAHYNVYRGTTSGGPYTKLNSASLTSPAYSDATGAGGTTYFYVVTAVCDSTATCPAGVSGESGFSNEVSAVFLGNPAAPGSLAAVSK